MEARLTVRITAQQQNKPQLDTFTFKLSPLLFVLKCICYPTFVLFQVWVNETRRFSKGRGQRKRDNYYWKVAQPARRTRVLSITEKSLHTQKNVLRKPAHATSSRRPPPSSGNITYVRTRQLSAEEEAAREAEEGSRQDEGKKRKRGICTPLASY